jgi:hypothetical protein
MNRTSPSIFQYLDENYWKISGTKEHSLTALNKAESAVVNYPENNKSTVLAGVVVLALNHNPTLNLTSKTTICKYASDCYRRNCRFAHSEAMTKAAQRAFDVLKNREAQKASALDPSEDDEKLAIYRTASGSHTDPVTAALSHTASSCALSVVD